MTSGAVITGAFASIFALEGDVSFVGTLSTWALTVAVPAVPFDVNKAVAVPDAWTVVCWPDKDPNVVGPQLTGNPIKTVRFATAMASLEELLSNPVVIVEVDSGEAHFA